MNAIRVKPVPLFKGEDVALLAVDFEGLALFVSALAEALQNGASRLQRRVRSHEFVIAEGAADIDIEDQCVIWRLDHAKACEILQKARTLGRAGACTGHHYVDDMKSPAGTLVMSLNEYLAPTWLTEGKVPIFTDEDPD